MARTAKTITLRLGLVFTVTGIIVLVIRHLAPGAALAIGIVLLVLGLVILGVRFRPGSGKSRLPGTTT
jgi:membrane-bound ClpP family serine protease